MSEAAQAQPYMPTRAAVEDWTTPEEVLVPVRKVFGGDIDFDPCGNPASIVGAKRQVWLPKWAESAGEGTVHVAGCLSSLGRAPYALGDEETRGEVIIGDGLGHEVPWSGSTFVNPPFSARELGRFMERSVQAAARGVPVIMLAKAKTGLKAWQAHVRSAAAVCFIAGRVTYGGGRGDPAPFESALILWSQSRTLINRFALEMECLGDTMFHR